MQEDARYFVVVNGAAGGGRCRSRADLALDRLREGGLELEVTLTEGPGHASELAREGFDAGHRRFLAVGGDGTSYEVINGLFPLTEGERVTLGSLPLGTGNSFLRDFGIIQEEAAFDALLRGETRAVDVIRVQHAEGVLHYINLLSVGFTADVATTANRYFKRLGTGGYGAAVIARVATLRHPIYHYRVDDEFEFEFPITFLSFCNSRYTGGAMMMAPEADCSDGQMDVICARRLSRTGLLAAFPKIFAGTHIDRPEIEASRARKVEILGGGEEDVMVDGEVLRLQLRSLEVIPGGLEVVA
ncbi:MAG: diacylglycerol kinase family lipid kinase [Myxococcales bacterium]|nr:diacylglycerol kinase family lipid kinase [Myxococcales bacterium]